MNSTNYEELFKEADEHHEGYDLNKDTNRLKNMVFHLFRFKTKRIVPRTNASWLVNPNVFGKNFIR